MIFWSGVLQKHYRQVLGARPKKPAGRDTMGTLIFWGVIVLGEFLGIVLISLSSRAQKAEEVYERMPSGDKIATRSDTYCLLVSGTLSPTGINEVGAQGDLSASVAAS
jgi:hypothetical protein